MGRMGWITPFLWTLRGYGMNATKKNYHLTKLSYVGLFGHGDSIR